MTDRELNHYRDRLAALMKTLREEVAHVTDETLRSGGGEAGGGISDVPLHQADLGSHEYEQRVAIDILTQKRQLLAEVKDAWERLEQHAFGRCELCHQWIPRERLEAMPYARHCLACAEKPAD